MTTNKSVGRSHAHKKQRPTEVNRFAGYCVGCWVVRKQVHRVESLMEYYWALRGKNAQNIKALICPL